MALSPSLRSHHILVVIEEGLPMSKCRGLGSWPVLPHDDSKVVAPYVELKRRLYFNTFEPVQSAQCSRNPCLH